MNVSSLPQACSATHPSGSVSTARAGVHLHASHLQDKFLALCSVSLPAVGVSMCVRDRDMPAFGLGSVGYDNTVTGV